jgi:hypothetical protein
VQQLPEMGTSSNVVAVVVTLPASRVWDEDGRSMVGRRYKRGKRALWADGSAKVELQSGWQW